MNNWKPKGQINITEALKRVWKEYPCASEMPEGDENDSRRYKAMSADDTTQTVYLIANPSTWETKYVGGRRVRVRPKPEVLGKLSEYTDSAPSTALPVPLGARNQQQKQIEW